MTTTTTTEMAGAVPEDQRRRDHVYEEIPFFAKKKVTDLDETKYAEEVHQRAVARRPGSPSSDEGNANKTVESDDPCPVHDLRSSPEIQKEMKPDDGGGGGGGENAPEEVPGRREEVRISARPKSIVGTPLFDNNEPEMTDPKINCVINDHLSRPSPPPPPSLPPKRVESATDPLDLVISSAGVLPSRHSSTNPNPEISRTPGDPVATPVERRQSSRVSTAVRTLGNASRSVLNTFRKLGGVVGRSSAVLVISGPEDGRQPDATEGEEEGEDKDPVKRPSPPPPPPPQQTLGDRPDVVPKGNFIDGSEEELTVAGLRL